MNTRVALASALLGLTISAAGQPGAEMTTRDQIVTFQTGVNLVLVPVVVRDAQGRAIGGLRKEDFQLFDRGKLQSISKFTVETSAGHPAAVPIPATMEKPTESPTPLPPAVAPDRFVAYLFDDLNLDVADTMRVREAARRHMSSLRPIDRAAIVTTSGVNLLDFTGDPDKLLQAVDHVQPRLALSPRQHQCPDLNYYWANLIRNDTGDPEPRDMAITEAWGCLQLPTDPANRQVVLMAVQEAVSSVMALCDQNSRASLSTLDETVRRISRMPGQRLVVLVSPGFLTPDMKAEESDIIDRAVRASVIINSLDGRGLYVEGPDLSKPSLIALPGTPRPPMELVRFRQKTEHQTAVLREEVLAEVAYGTGGSYFHNNNDLAEGFRQLAAPPEYVYLLGFAPQNLKLDGAFHGLKVTVKGPAGLSLVARRGYTAPRGLTDPVEVAKEEIRQALFSREELHDFSTDLHSDFFKPTADTAKLAVMVHVDLKPLGFKKENGRSRDDLAVTVGLFDRDGNYISGMRKDVELRLKDESLDRWMQNGIRVPCSFELKPGMYLLRLVVRDTAGQMAAQNGVVEIPR